METFTQDPQKPTSATAKAANDGEDAYKRLPVIFQKFVDRQVENRGRLLLGYQEILDGAKQGRPVRGEDLDRLQEEYMYEYRKQQKEISSFFTAASYISDISQPKEEQPYGGQWSWSEPDEKKSQEKNQPVAGKEDRQKDHFPDRPDVAKNKEKGSQEESTPVAGKEGRQKSEHFPGQPEGDKDKSKNEKIAPESRFTKKYRKMFEVVDNIDAAHKYKIEQWNEDHEDKLKGLDIDAINSALLKQSRKSGEMPRENIKLDPETKDTPELLKDLLSKNPGIAIADVHVFDDSFTMVDKHMGTLKQAGVDTIYIELDPDWVKKVASLSPEDMQKLQTEGKLGDISIRTAQQNAWNYKIHTSEDFFAGMLNMIKSAKEHGIAVKGMDEYQMAEVKETAEWRRIGVSNAVWTDNIRKDRGSLPEAQQKTGKYIVIGGMAHFMGDGIVDERLGIPTIGFTKIARDGQPEIQALHAPTLPDFLISSKGYVNTHTLMRALSFNRLGKRLENVPLSPGAALLARGAAYYTKLQAKNEMKNMREEFERDRPVKDYEGLDPLIRYKKDTLFGEPILPPITPDAKETKSKMILPEQTKSGGVRISSPEDVRETEIMPSPNIPTKPAQGSEKRGI